MNFSPSPNTRAYWIEVAARLASPVLGNLSRRTLRKNMPVETHGGVWREKFTHLEAFGRLLAGIAPWLELDEPEYRPLAEMARAALDAATDPDSPDFCVHSGEPPEGIMSGKGVEAADRPGVVRVGGVITDMRQQLVDTAFLAQGLLRAPRVLWEPLDTRVRENLLRALRATRVFCPSHCNWLLFSAMIETALKVFGAQDWDRMRIDYAIRQHEQWYKGDGHYGDGALFRADYYNSFVIQPMLVDILRHTADTEWWKDFEERIWTRSIRYAGVLERFISPEGTFPPIGRSLVYRFGALQSLAQMALLHRLEEGTKPAQVREALTAVIRRMIEAPGTFDEHGWLRIGFCGAQLELGEKYISTGSLYLCAAGLLPLGLPSGDPFWADPPAPWTAVKAWGGMAVPIDRTIV